MNSPKGRLPGWHAHCESVEDGYIARYMIAWVLVPKLHHAPVHEMLFLERLDSVDQG